MKSVRRRFKIIKEKNSYWSTYVCFAGAISDQEFSERSIRKHFNNLVDKEDYLPSEKQDVVIHLIALTKSS